MAGSRRLTAASVRSFAGAAAGAALVAATVGGCTGSTAAHSGAVGASAAPVVRWWTNSGAAQGSAIDTRDPLAVARRLPESRTDYCGMLRQTLAAGGSPLLGLPSAGPDHLVATQAFLGELEHVAPGPVHAAWQTLAPATLALVTSTGKPTTTPGADATAVQRAAAAVATDAKQACGVDLSKRTG